MCDRHRRLIVEQPDSELSRRLTQQRELCDAARTRAGPSRTSSTVLQTSRWRRSPLDPDNPASQFTVITLRQATGRRDSVLSQLYTQHCTEKVTDVRHWHKCSVTPILPTLKSADSTERSTGVELRNKLQRAVFSAKCSANKHDLGLSVLQSYRINSLGPVRQRHLLDKRCIEHAGNSIKINFNNFR